MHIDARTIIVILCQAQTGHIVVARLRLDCDLMKAYACRIRNLGVQLRVSCKPGASRATVMTSSRPHKQKLPRLQSQQLLRRNMPLQQEVIAIMQVRSISSIMLTRNECQTPNMSQ